MQFFAHSGHDHNSAQNTLDVLAFISVNAAPFIVLGLTLLILRYVVGLKPAPLLILALVFMLISGLTLYPWAPVASIISLVTGFGLSLALLIVPLKVPHKQ